MYEVEQGKRAEGARMLHVVDRSEAKGQIFWAWEQP